MSLDKQYIRKEINRISMLKHISYEELMQENIKVLSLAKYHLKDKETQKKLKDIKKRALKISIKRIANQNPLYHLFLSKNHPAVEKASREVYYRQNGKTSVQQLIEDADCVYYQKHKFRNLKQFLIDIRNIGDKPQDFTVDVFYKKEQGLGRAIKNKFGTIGKAIMLAGIDYSQKGNSNTPRSKYSYSLSEFLMIANDNSLNESEKSACIFNALSFQHYDLGFSSEPERIFEESEENKNSGELRGREIRKRDSKRFPIIVRWLETQDNYYGNYNVELSLSNKIKNKFHGTNFYFNKDKSHAKMDCFKIYMGLDRILDNIRA